MLVEGPARCGARHGPRGCVFGAAMAGREGGGQTSIPEGTVRDGGGNRVGVSAGATAGVVLGESASCGLDEHNLGACNGNEGQEGKEGSLHPCLCFELMCCV